MPILASILSPKRPTPCLVIPALRTDHHSTPDQVSGILVPVCAARMTHQYEALMKLVGREDLATDETQLPSAKADGLAFVG